MQPEEKNLPILELNASLAEIRQHPDNEELLWKCARLLEDLATNLPLLAAYQPVIYELLQILLCGNAVSHQPLAPLSVQQLKFKYEIKPETNPAEDESLLAQDRLFLATLEKTLNTDEIEQRLDSESSSHRTACVY